MKKKENNKKKISRAKKKKIHHDDGEGNWLVSYADMMTLIASFFIIVSAMSSPDPTKFEKLKKATAEAMGGDYVNPYNSIREQIEDKVSGAFINNKIEVLTLLDGVKIVIKASTFFTPGSYSLRPNALEIIKNIGNVLVETPDQFKILVEGHTDDVPMTSQTIPSNWELSFRRASEVVKLFEKIGIAKNRLRPSGLADTEPIVQVNGIEGDALIAARDANRRIVIRIKKILERRSSK